MRAFNMLLSGRIHIEAKFLTLAESNPLDRHPWLSAPKNLVPTATLDVRGSVRNTVAPVVRMAAVMLKSENAKLGNDAIVDRVWKARHEVTTNVGLDDPATSRSLVNNADGNVDGVEKLRGKAGNSPLVEPSCLNEFRLSIWVINQAHPMARRAACMTSSCERPVTAPDESS